MGKRLDGVQGAALADATFERGTRESTGLCFADGPCSHPRQEALVQQLSNQFVSGSLVFALASALIAFGCGSLMQLLALEAALFQPPWRTAVLNDQLSVVPRLPPRLQPDRPSLGARAPRGPALRPVRLPPGHPTVRFRSATAAPVATEGRRRQRFALCVIVADATPLRGRPEPSPRFFTALRWVQMQRPLFRRSSRQVRRPRERTAGPLHEFVATPPSRCQNSS